MPGWTDAIIPSSLILVSWSSRSWITCSTRWRAFGLGLYAWRGW